jgi:hypothetical protein
MVPTSFCLNAAPQRWFWFACLFEAAVGLVAVPVGFWLGVDWVALWDRPGMREALAGVAICLPLLALPWGVIHSSWRGFRRIREVLDAQLLPVMSGWTNLQLLAISLLAGTAEECLFRGAIQAGLAPSLGATGGLLVASVLFGLCHAVSRFYAALAAGMGVVLGLELHLTGSLATPIITHALYDFLALLYLLRRHRVPA